MRIAIIDRKKCIKEKCGYLCQKYCPGVRMGDETIITDTETGYPIISELLCTGCGICTKKCPIAAIKIINLAEEVGNVIYQYGANMFRLYGLPLPKEGVVGFIGKNGIGKTTALKILAGKLVPNFGDYTKEYSLKDALTRMRAEEQYYFKQLIRKQETPEQDGPGPDNGITVSYKPQHVDKIPQVFHGTVAELLNMVEPKRKDMDMKTVLDTFSLSQLKDRKLDTLSGGELQRVAIAAAWMKDADIYYFDEPSSYLDIEERLKTAQRIKSLAEQTRPGSVSKKKVIGSKIVVVEHDLALLDYLSDYVYIFFGVENAYGAVSQVRNSRNGINEYLNGYLRTENIRFRDYEIRFEKKSASVEEDMGQAGATQTGETLVEYPSLVKTFPNFLLTVESGSLRKGEVIGIIGKNAIGKSLFVKMLAGVIKPDNIDYCTRLKVSYKPQYIKIMKDMTVRELFSKMETDSFVLNESIRRLNIGPVMDRMLSELSGGELQRVSISAALSQEANLYLFDEPSAFLDIEQRIHFVHLVRTVIGNSEKSAFIVDHDTVVIDLVSDRLLLFDGESGIKGEASAPTTKNDGMNAFLKRIGITMRRDKDTLRPRINKPGSVLDREQKESGEYYYSF